MNQTRETETVSQILGDEGERDYDERGPTSWLRATVAGNSQQHGFM